MASKKAVDIGSGSDYSRFQFIRTDNGQYVRVTSYRRLMIGNGAIKGESEATIDTLIQCKDDSEAQSKLDVIMKGLHVRL